MICKSGLHLTTTKSKYGIIEPCYCINSIFQSGTVKIFLLAFRICHIDVTLFRMSCLLHFHETEIWVGAIDSCINIYDTKVIYELCVARALWLTYCLDLRIENATQIRFIHFYSSLIQAQTLNLGVHGRSRD